MLLTVVGSLGRSIERLDTMVSSSRSNTLALSLYTTWGFRVRGGLRGRVPQVAQVGKVDDDTQHSAIAESTCYCHVNCVTFLLRNSNQGFRNLLSHESECKILEKH